MAESPTLDGLARLWGGCHPGGPETGRPAPRAGPGGGDAGFSLRLPGSVSAVTVTSGTDPGPGRAD